MTVLARYSFDGSSASATETLAGVTASPLTNSGLTFNIDSPGVSLSGMPLLRTGSNSNASQYFTFGLSGMKVIEKLTFKACRGGSSVNRGFRIRSSTDGYASDIYSVDNIPTSQAWTDYEIPTPMLVESVTFRVYLKTDDDAGKSVWFDDIEIHGSTIHPSEEMPQNLRAVSATQSTVTVAWGAPAGPEPDSYLVEWGTETGVYTGSASISGEALTHTIAGLAPGTIVYVRVEAVYSDTDLNTYSGEIAFASEAENPAGVVRSLAGLRELAELKRRMFVEGGAADYDGAGGLFRLELNSTADDDSGLVIVTDSGHRYHRAYLGTVFCEWFGAKPGASAATNLAAIRAALATGRNVAITEPGVYKIDGDIVFETDNQHFYMGPGVEFRMVSDPNNFEYMLPDTLNESSETIVAAMLQVRADNVTLELYGKFDSNVGAAYESYGPGDQGYEVGENTERFVFPIIFWQCEGSRTIGRWEVVNSRSSCLLIDCDRVKIGGLITRSFTTYPIHSDQLSMVSMEGCIDCTVHDFYCKDAWELVDLNNYNAGIAVRDGVVVNTQRLEMNDDQDVSIINVKFYDSQVARFEPYSGAHRTERSKPTPTRRLGVIRDCTVILTKTLAAESVVHMMAGGTNQTSGLVIDNLKVVSSVAMTKPVILAEREMQGLRADVDVVCPSSTGTMFDFAGLRGSKLNLRVQATTGSAGTVLSVADGTEGTDYTTDIYLREV